MQRTKPTKIIKMLKHIWKENDNSRKWKLIKINKRIHKIKEQFQKETQLNFYKMTANQYLNEIDSCVCDMENWLSKNQGEFLSHTSSHLFEVFINFFKKNLTIERRVGSYIKPSNLSIVLSEDRSEVIGISLSNSGWPQYMFSEYTTLLRGIELFNQKHKSKLDKLKESFESKRDSEAYKRQINTLIQCIDSFKF